MTIKNKMLVTVIGVMLLLVGLGAAIFSQIFAYNTLAHSRTETVALEVDILQLRRHEKAFFARKDTKYADAFEQRYSGALVRLDTVEALLDSAAIDTSGFEQVRQELAAFGDSFRQIVTLQKNVGLHERDGLYGELRTAVHAAESIFKAQNNFEMQTHMLMLRRAEKDFMLRRSTKYLDKFNSSFTDMQAAMDRSELGEDERRQAGALLNTYRSKFLGLVEAEAEIGLTQKEGELGGLSKAVHQIDALIDQIETALGKKIEESEQSILLTLSLSLIGVGSTIGAWLVWLGWTISRRAALAAGNMHEIAQGDGDLTRRLDASGRDEFAQLAESFNLFAGKIHSMLKNIATTSTMLSETSGQVADAAGSTNNSMQQLGLNTQTVVVATEELSATARDVSSSASQVSSSSQEADDLAARGRQTVQQSIDSINAFAGEFQDASAIITKLHGETENIGGILDVIRGIAEQTNLLALNAAIEAARAGEQGRGFAVVADEVRTLAHRSQQSTNEIQELITRLQEGADSAVSMIQNGQDRIGTTLAKAENAGDALVQITDAIGQINSMTMQIATAAEEQSTVVENISGSVNEIDAFAQGTLRDAERTSEMTGGMEQAVSEVVGELRHFHLE